VHRESRNGQVSRDECFVRFWQGYVTGQFQAYRSTDPEPFLCSRTFRTWRPPWQPKVEPENSEAAVAAFRALAAELTRRGWHADASSETFEEQVFVRDRAVAGPLGAGGPASIAEPFVLRALRQVAGEEGATAAEVGRALYGEEASSVPQLPQRVGTRLRRLQLQGKVDRRETNGVNHWFPTSPDKKESLATH
jgi:hypothetical protein